MAEEESASEAAQDVTPEVVAPEAQVEESSQASPQGDKEYNFKALREGKEALEKKVRELEETVAKLSPPASEPEKESPLGDDDLVEGKHLRQVAAQLQKALQQRDMAALPDRLRSRFSDFDKVVSEANVEKLKKEEPEIFESLSSGKDPFAIGVSAYKTIRALYGNTEERARIEENSRRPRSVQTANSPLHEANLFANGLTPELKAQLQKEMREAIRSA